MDWISGGALARKLGVRSSSLRAMIASGGLPPPFAHIGDRTRLWRRAHYEEFLASGRWPEAAWHRRR